MTQWWKNERRRWTRVPSKVEPPASSTCTTYTWFVQRVPRFVTVTEPPATDAAALAAALVEELTATKRYRAVDDGGARRAAELVAALL